MGKLKPWKFYAKLGVITIVSLLWSVIAAAQERGPSAHVPAFQSAPGSMMSPGRRVDTSKPLPRPEVRPLPEASQYAPDESPVSPEEYRAMKWKVEHGLLPTAPGAQKDHPAEESPYGISGGISPSVNPEAPGISLNSNDISFTNAIPPDPTIAVGPYDLVVAVNAAASGQLVGKVRIHYGKSMTTFSDFDLLHWFANVLPDDPTGIKIFDPWVLYDWLDGRFILLAAAKAETGSNTGFSSFLISVSPSNSASGSWCTWSLNARLDGSTDTNNWADYPRAGVTKNAIILSANMYAFSGGFQYAKLRFLPKADFYDSTCSDAISYWDLFNLLNVDGTKAFTIVPSRSYVKLTTNYLINSRSGLLFDTPSGQGTTLTLWRAITPDSFPPAPTLVRSTLSVPAYGLPPSAQQPGTTTRIDTRYANILDAVWRTTGLWATHTVSCSWAGDTELRSCIGWYQINPAILTVMQRGIYGSPGQFYFYPAIEPDDAQDAFLVFNRSSSSGYVSIRQTGRRQSDPLGILQGSALLKAGQGCYVRLDPITGKNRWGDYNGIAIEPYDLATSAWIFSAYAFGTSTSCSANTWQTAIGFVHW